MGEQLGQVLDPLACLALDPGGRGAVPARALRPGDLAVGDIADEQMPEGVLALALHRAHPGRADELLASQLVQRKFELGLIAAADLGQRAHPEHLPEHGRVLKQALPIRRERVQAGGDQRLQTLRQLRLVGTQVSVGEQAHELLGVERVPACPLQHALLQLGAEHAGGDQVGNELGGLPI